MLFTLVLFLVTAAVFLFQGVAPPLLVAVHHDVVGQVVDRASLDLYLGVALRDLDQQVFVVASQGPDLALESGYEQLLGVDLLAQECGVENADLRNIKKKMLQCDCRASAMRSPMDVADLRQSW